MIAQSADPARSITDRDFEEFVPQSQVFGQRGSLCPFCRGRLSGSDEFGLRNPRVAATWHVDDRGDGTGSVIVTGDSMNQHAATKRQRVQDQTPGFTGWRRQQCQ